MSKEDLKMSKEISEVTVDYGEYPIDITNYKKRPYG